VNPLVGSGLVLWHPKGAIIRGLLESFVQDELQRRGYLPVYTPNIGRVELYETSGHYPYYKDSMFAPIIMEQDEQYLLRPMNCPHHVMIYKSKPRSYRELPLRLAEFGTVYRYEQSGELSGMTRVRSFTQDDAHIFCTPEQVADEFHGCLEMTQFVLKSLGLDNYRVRLGFRDPESDKYVGDDQRWQEAEAALLEVCQGLGVEPTVEEGEAAFYGPKADFVLTDCIGREWQLGTVQVDYNLPERFDLSYIGADNAPHRPVMVHRAPFGSFERFVGILIEHFEGAFPTWLAPEQARVLPISEKFTGYATEVRELLRSKGLRVGLDDGDDRVNSKIKAGSELKIPYLLVVGGKEEEARTVSVRRHGIGEEGAVPLEEFVDSIVTEVNQRDLPGKRGAD
ncbi:MAG TPA: threonine--tRNA ligase, partial [Planctomycetes bacterium]|nr:threonine--tRNA ligase [Planctomycetota bacterium]